MTMKRKYDILYVCRKEEKSRQNIPPSIPPSSNCNDDDDDSNDNGWLMQLMRGRGEDRHGEERGDLC